MAWTASQMLHNRHERNTVVGHTETIGLFSSNKATSIKLPLIEFSEGRWEIIIELLCQTLKLKFSIIKMKIVCNTAIDMVFSKYSKNELCLFSNFFILLIFGRK